MGAYIGANERFGSGDQDPNQGRFEQVICESPALESAYREIAELKHKLAQKKLYLEDEIRGELDFEGIVGQSSALRHVLNLVETVASSDSTVLLLGETGTGKELIARAIHDRSHRKERTFVKLNCAAIPTGLLESELFGHERGAFTGAIAQKIGRLELADQGSLFLDEVGDIPIEIQPKLLRALQEREFERLGSNRTKQVDAVVAESLFSPFQVYPRQRLDGWIRRRIWSHRYRRWRNAGWKRLPATKIYGEYELVRLIYLIPSLASWRR